METERTIELLRELAGEAHRRGYTALERQSMSDLVQLTRPEVHSRSHRTFTAILRLLLRAHTLMVK